MSPLSSSEPESSALHAEPTADLDAAEIEVGAVEGCAELTDRCVDVVEGACEM